MNIFDSYVDAGQRLPVAERQAYYTALVEYLAYGVEPDLDGVAGAVLVAIMPSLEQSRAKSQAGRSGGRGNKGGRTSKATQKPALPAPGADSETAGQDTDEKQNAENGKAELPICEKQNPHFGESRTGVSGKAKSKGKGKKKEELPGGSSKKAASRFAPPSVAEVSAYASEIGAGIDPGRFCDFYESKGWRVGSSPMRDWRAAVRNWAARDRSSGGRRGEVVRDEFQGVF